MEQRKLLDKGTTLGFPGMTCTIEECVGYGSNAVVYRGWYEDSTSLDQRHHVLIKELNPIRRDHLEAHRLSFERGNRAHLRLLEKHPEIIGENINTFSYHNTLYTLLGCSGGVSLDRVLRDSGPGTTLRRHAERMLGVLDALEAFHDSGCLHLDVSPDNILVIRRGATERILLIDYNSVFSLEECRSGDMPYTSVKEGFTAPEITTGNYARIGYAADLYSVAAVFFACLTGRSLRGIVEKRKCGVPAVMDSECLADAPDTVRSMVAEIMLKGLCVLPQSRYQEISQMKEDLLELIDRIDCVGVTHWAIWEKSRQSLNRAIQDNPSLQYVTDEEDLYPIQIRDADGREMDVEAFVDDTLMRQDGPVMLAAGGGMGKTTAMLRMALLQNQKYSPRRTAAVYISAYRRTAEEPYFIKNRILDMLRFGAGTASYEQARHELDLLLASPLAGEDQQPALLILLDGVNEAPGDLTLLAREIAELSKMAGVRIVLSSRGEMQDIRCRSCEIVPLSEEHVARKLSQNGLLLPENEQMRALLTTPMALSIFIKAAKGETGQLRVSSTKELIQAYLNALLHKETGDMPQGAPQRYMIEAAVHAVLPRIAGEAARRGRALTGLEALRAAEDCYRLLGSREMLRAFPAWIGHSQDIRGSAKSAEEWYGIVVGELLWRRMGLLTADEDGHYRIAHQLIEETLIEVDRENRKNIGRRRAISRAKAAAAAAVLAAMLCAYYFAFIYVKPYQENLALSVMDYAGSSYVQCGLEYQEAYEVVSLALGGDLLEFNVAYDLYKGGSSSTRGWIERSAAQAASSMLETGEAFAWSKRPLNTERYQELAVRAGEREAVYAGYLSVLHAAMNDESAAQGEAQAYAELVLDFLNADAAVSASLYELVTREHVDEAWTGRTGYASMFNEINRQEQYRMQIMDKSPEDFAFIHEANRGNLQEAENALRRSVLSVKYSL